MSRPLQQHQWEIQRNRAIWSGKLLLRKVYGGFYQQILEWVDRQIPGRIVEVGSGVGNLKEWLPEAVATDIFPHPWLDVVCDGYALPFRDGCLSHLVLFDVFHHLEAPAAFFREARRVLHPSGRVILFEPYISLCSWPVYGLAHPEPVGWWRPIAMGDEPPRVNSYYAAQGNATRLFFRAGMADWPPGWKRLHARAFSAFHYLLSGGFSRPALYPERWLGRLRQLDDWLSRLPRCFGARCLVVLTPGS